VSILGRTIPVENNTFEALLKNISPSQKQVEVYANTATEKQLLGKYPLTFLKAPNPSERFMEGVASIEKEYTKDSKTVQGTLVNQQAALTLQDAENDNYEIHITALAFKDLEPIGSGMVNITKGRFPGYSVAAEGLSENATRQLSLAYDSQKIPDGYTPKDIKIFYFEEDSRSWKALPVDSIDYAHSKIITTISEDSETDYINGIIKVPENPETAGF